MAEGPGWPAMLRLAAARYGLAPEAFWRLSLAEWRALTSVEVAAALDRRGFEDLAAQYPDSFPSPLAGEGNHPRGP